MGLLRQHHRWESGPEHGNFFLHTLPFLGRRIQTSLHTVRKRLLTALFSVAFLHSGDGSSHAYLFDRRPPQRQSLHRDRRSIGPRSSHLTRLRFARRTTRRLRRSKADAQVRVRGRRRWDTYPRSDMQETWGQQGPLRADKRNQSG